MRNSQKRRKVHALLDERSEMFAKSRSRFKNVRITVLINLKLFLTRINLFKKF
jgi:hypothetical protein